MKKICKKLLTLLLGMALVVSFDIDARGGGGGHGGGGHGGGGRGGHGGGRGGHGGGRGGHGGRGGYGRGGYGRGGWGGRSWGGRGYGYGGYGWGGYGLGVGLGLGWGYGWNRPYYWGNYYGPWQGYYYPRTVYITQATEPVRSKWLDDRGKKHWDISNSTEETITVMGPEGRIQIKPGKTATLSHVGSFKITVKAGSQRVKEDTDAHYLDAAMDKDGNLRLRTPESESESEEEGSE
ncbi:MAG: hypothetical protein NTX86_03765 [Candidatus Dependentiae bacterium]|nr:hypothetical protein [Candidatus Dependentiae bacterium]